ncbi:glycosyltransferase family 4 protein [Pontibacter sp. SD6]|uniref:Glycosyltransferase family 4 protein n=2 Tax=Pontibacter cellulosilyticus TaxID=1720253 RepID=A0A923N3L8_9BACT|nr:glycosyltransferase family 4 protein [Pontibacter cellulosilyticus]
MKALLNSSSVSKVKVSSAYDASGDLKYVKASQFTGYAGKRIQYLLDTIKAALSADILITGHINLSLVGVLAKVLRPKLTLVCIAHGIDVWYDLSKLKRLMLIKSDHILSVSSFTRQKLIERHKLSTSKISVFPNTLDPYFKLPSSFLKPEYLLRRYKVSETWPVLLSVCRLSSLEGYKGYDTVISALPAILKVFPDVKYIIVGKYDQGEYRRINSLTKELGVEDHVLLTGFVPEVELTDHFLLGDVYTMPSREEGFGIVYIEAMACGLPVIAGNADGSVDALDHGKLGTLIDPTNSVELADATVALLRDPMSLDQKRDLQRRVMDKFGFERFSSRLNQFLEEIKK